MSKECYRSPYEAYPFLSEEPGDLRCDFELLTDELSSLTGLLRAGTKDKVLSEELLQVNTLIYHCNPTLRTCMTVSPEETEWLKERTLARLNAGPGGFVLPQGTANACTAHILRVKAKQLVRLLYRCAAAGGSVPEPLFDFCNLLSGYFFGLALLYNREEGVSEVEFTSRNYE